MRLLPRRLQNADGQQQLETGVFGFGLLVVVAAGLQSFIAFQLLAVAVNWHPLWTTYIIQVVVEFAIFAAVFDTELRKKLKEKGGWVPRLVAYAAMAETVAINLLSHLIVSGGGQTLWRQVALGALAVTMPGFQIAMAHLMSARLDRRDESRRRRAQEDYEARLDDMNMRYTTATQELQARHERARVSWQTAADEAAEFAASGLRDQLAAADRDHEQALLEVADRHAQEKDVLTAEIRSLRERLGVKEPSTPQVNCNCRGSATRTPCAGKLVSAATEIRHRNEDARR